MTAKFFGFNPPFIGGSQNIMSRQEDARLIKNDILQLLLTVPGERVMRPNFGVELRTFVFEQFDETDLLNLEEEIRNKITETDNRVDVQSVELEPDRDNNGLTIKVVVTLKSDPKVELEVEQFIPGRG